MKRFRLKPASNNLWLLERRFMLFFWKPCYESDAAMKSGHLDYPLYVDCIKHGENLIKLIKKYEAGKKAEEKKDSDFVKSNKSVYFD